MATLGDYDFFGNQTADFQRSVNDASYKAFKPIKVDGGNSSGYKYKGENNLGGYGDYLGAGMDIANIGLAGMNAYTGWQNLGLAQDQFNFEKAATNRNIANQGKQINNAYTNASQVGLALGGGAMTSDQIAAENAALQNRYVDTRPIG